MTAWPGNVLDRTADTASYTCRSSRNDAGPPVNSTTKFAVEYEPENITVTPSTVRVTEGDIPEKVVCAARGFPMPSYSWRRGNSSKAMGKEHSNNSLVLSSSNTLLLGPVQRKDVGHYLCEAYNRHGSVYTTAFLDVLSGTQVWWRDRQQLILIGCIALAVLVITVILCIIIICICRRMRAKSKYNNPVELEERENPKTSDRTRLVDSQSYPEANKSRESHSSSLQANLSQLEATINANKSPSRENEDNEQQTPKPEPRAHSDKVQTVVTPSKWPLKPGVLVHVNSNHTLSPKNQARMAANVSNNNEKEDATLGLLERNKSIIDDETSPSKSEYSKKNGKPRRHTQSVVSGIFKNLRKRSDNDSDDDSGKYKKINKTNKRAVSLVNLNKPGYSLPKSKIRSFFQSETPNVIVTEGVVSFKRPDRIAASIKPLNDEASKCTRKRKAPGDSPPTNGIDNAANGNLGADNPGLYENLPFHGLQQAPNKPVQAIQPRIDASKTAKGIEALQKQLTTNPSFTPRIVCPPFVQNIPYPITTASNSQYQYGIPLLSPIQQMYPLHQTVLLNPYLPPMQTSFLKQFPTIDEEVLETDTKKFSSLNTRNPRKLPQFQSMRAIRKRNIERFYPNTEYGENFTEINNNKGNRSNRDSNEHENIIYANFPSLLNVKSNISGVEEFENLTDSIQVYEESNGQMNVSTNSLRPVPAPRTKISPMSSPEKTDHVYVNLSMPLINTKFSTFDVVDAPIRPTKSAEDVSKKLSSDKDSERLKLDNNVGNENGDSDDEGNSENPDEKRDLSKPNIIGATPKRNTSIILPSTSLVKSAVSKLNDQGMNKVGLPKKQVISPNKTLQIPKLTEKPIPKRNPIRRSNSVQSSITINEAQPFKPDDQFIYADADLKDYGPINYKQASIYSQMKKVKEQQRLQQIYDKEHEDLL
ncbi:hypothetical protein MSG28_015692 [Choristoneura fumiferana]|uniref:Uncharacterized protein n=1 Tax=Choristoneura fumiferana TaxID=7141 RepID=A0ACC0KBY4_CHOFU|nr:hypothetical protein MSG28_015692 [Choristoneura fumiferana]